MLSTLSRFQRALTPETVARHQPRGGGRQSDGTPSPLTKTKLCFQFPYFSQIR